MGVGRDVGDQSADVGADASADVDDDIPLVAALFVREPEDAFKLEPFGVLRRRDRDENLFLGTGGHAA